MEQFKYIQPLDQMARISRTELGEKLDEILDKADKDNVGFVITDEGKDDLVLCPIRWMKCIYDDDFGCIVNSALRYAIGRHTYMPSVVMEFVRKYLSVLDSKTICVMIEDIEREAEFETLDKRGDWLKLRDDLKTYYSEMLQKSENSKADQYERMKPWVDAGVKMVENESSAIFIIAKRLGLRAGSICLSMGSMIEGTEYYVGPDSGTAYPQTQEPGYFKAREKRCCEVATRAAEILDEWEKQGR